MFQERKIRDGVDTGENCQKDQVWTMLVWNLPSCYVCIIKVCCVVINDLCMALLLCVYRTVHVDITQ